ncbi:MAG: TonB family protein [Chlorobiota bacterium]|nr:MAG: TonB family protein [Chlorobiota bacterium]
MTEEKKNQTDIEELIFAKKNKEYGAYKLRKAYKTYLALAMWIAIFVVLMVTTGPAVYRMINPETVEVTKKRVVQITQLEQPPSIGEQKEIEQVEAPPPLKSTIKFTPPVVKPDEQVKDEYIPTVDELKEVDPGTETQEGNPEGVDYSLIEVEEKVVEKEEAPTYFVAVEEMPELAFVNENGDVTKAQILKGIGAGCDEAARDAVLQTKFKPGKQRGVPVKVQVSIPIVFKLQ